MIDKEKLIFILTQAFWMMMAVKLAFQISERNAGSMLVDTLVVLIGGLLMMLVLRHRQWSTTVRTSCALILTEVLDLYLAWSVKELTLTPLVMALLVVVAATLLERRAVLAAMLAGDTLIILFAWLSPEIAFAELSRVQMVYLMIMMNAMGWFAYFVVRWIDRQIARREQIAREADSAAQAKSEFLARASHEIRTPMNAIFGMNELILAAPDGAPLPELKQRAASIKASGMDLLMLINDILDISKMEQGKISLIEVDYDAQMLMDRIVGDARTLLQGKPIKLVTDVEFPLSRAMTGDDVRIRQIVMSILSNAIKFTDSGEIALIVSQSHHGDERIDLTVRITDTGKGMRKETVDRLLNADSAQWVKESAESAGMGIGMAIATQLLGMMDGQLHIESVPGRGSRFYLRIPQHACDMPPDDVLHADLYFRGAKVLVVDDNPANLQINAGIFKNYGIDIDQALSGQQAIDMARAHHYALIFMDHMMPGMDGLEATSHLRGLGGHNQSVPIVALTANNDRGMEAFFKAGGMDNYLIKPIENLELERVLRAYLASFACAGKSQQIEAFDAEHLRLRLPGVDVNQGVAHCGGTLTAYKEVLRVFAGSGPEQIRRMQQCFNADDAPGFAIEAHSLKSVSASIGAQTLSALAADIERLAKVSDRTGGVKLIGPLFSEYTRILDAVTPIVHDQNAQVGPATGAPLEMDELIRRLEAIATCAEVYDMEGAKAELCHIQARPLRAGTAKGISELGMAIDQFSYEQTSLCAQHLVGQLRAQTGGAK